MLTTPDFLKCQPGVNSESLVVLNKIARQTGVDGWEVSFVLVLHNLKSAGGHYGRITPKHLANQSARYISYNHQTYNVQ